MSGVCFVQNGLESGSRVTHWEATAVFQVSDGSGSDRSSCQMATGMVGFIYFRADTHKSG